MRRSRPSFFTIPRLKPTWAKTEGRGMEGKGREREGRGRNVAIKLQSQKKNLK